MSKTVEVEFKVYRDKVHGFGSFFWAARKRPDVGKRFSIGWVQQIRFGKQPMPFGIKGRLNDSDEINS